MSLEWLQPAFRESERREHDQWRLRAIVAPIAVLAVSFVVSTLISFLAFSALERKKEIQSLRERVEELESVKESQR